MSLARIGIRGAVFTSLALGFRQVIALSATFYVARQLMPSDIGLFSMVMVVIGLAQVVGDVGIATGLVRSQKNTSDVLSTCFWIAAGIGFILAIVVFFLAPIAAWFYSKPEITPFLRVSAVGIMINFLTPVPMALLQQRLAYKEIAIAQGLSSLIGASTAVMLVYSGFGIWGLVFQPIVGNILMLGVMSVYARWHPTFEFKLYSVEDILKMGVHLLGSGLTSYLKNNFDTVIIGKTLLPRDLGLYGMAQTILYAPMHLITSTVSRVIFPLLAKVKDDLECIREGVLTATARTALLVFPLYFGLFMLADEFVFIVFGLNWMDMVFLIRVMTIAFVVQSIGTFSGPLLLALGKSKLLMQVGMINASFYFVILLILIPYGLTAIAIGYAVINAVTGVITLVISLHYARISMADYIASIAKPFLLTIIMCLLILTFKIFLVFDGVLQFSLLVVSGAIAYTILVFFFEKMAWQQLLGALRKDSN